MDRSAVFSTFVEKWVGSWEPTPDAEHMLEETERQVCLELPAAYRQFVLLYGTPSTAWLLDSIVEGHHHIEDLQEFIELDQLVRATEMYESGGMDSGFLAFAMDGMGNMFLFKRAECVREKNDAPVWFFDHDFVTVEKVAESFTEWLSRYNEIAVVKG